MGEGEEGDGEVDEGRMDGVAVMLLVDIRTTSY